MAVPGVTEIAISLFLGKTVLFWSGVIAGILFFTTLLFGYLTYKGKIEFKLHKRIAFTTAIFAVIHILLALSIYF